MSKMLIAYGVTAVVFLSIDAVWLGYVARGIYVDQIGHLMRERPNFGAAAVFYLIFVIGIVFFAVNPALERGAPLVALGYGALFGFFAYATYDVTNYSTLRDWPIGVAVLDTVWGATLTGVSAFAGYWVTSLVTSS